MRDHFSQEWPEEEPTLDIPRERLPHVATQIQAGVDAQYRARAFEDWGHADLVAFLKDERSRP